MQEHKQDRDNAVEGGTSNVRMFQIISYNLQSEKQGYKIKTEIVKIETKHFANYKLI